MPLPEFTLIDRYFAHQAGRRDDVPLGIGDDAALLSVPEGMDLVVAIDTLVEGVHFPAATDPVSIGHKALAVNLSDLAAMGAKPAWATLALTLPQADEAWLEGFCSGFFRLAARHHVALVGGDTTRGPLTVTVQAHGFAPRGAALRRTGARPGDALYVTGLLGEAALGLAVIQEGIRLPWSAEAAAVARLNRPQPRVVIGRALLGVASAAIDVSDGFAADLGHLLEGSGVGAEIDLDALPLSEAVQRRVEEQRSWRLPLAGGDDYELIFSVPPEREARLLESLEGYEDHYTRVGTVVAEAGVHWRGGEGIAVSDDVAGYLHFR